MLCFLDVHHILVKSFIRSLDLNLANLCIYCIAKLEPLNEEDTDVDF